MTSYILLVPIQIFENLQTSPCSCVFKTDKASGDLQKLSFGISTVCPLNDSRKTKLGRRRAKPIIHLLLPREQAECDTESQPYINLFCYLVQETSRFLLKLRGRTVS